MRVADSNSSRTVAAAGATRTRSRTNGRPLRRRLRRRGVMIPLIALALVIFIVMMAFSVDIAYMQLARTKMRVAADAAARAAGETLARTQDKKKSRKAAQAIASANYVGGQPLVLDNSDVLFGNADRQSDGSWSFTEGATPTNAVRIEAKRTSGSALGEIPLIFGRLLGRDQFALAHSATVVRLERDICLVVDRSSSMKLDVAETAGGMSTSDARFCQVPDPVTSRWAALEDAIDEFMTEIESTTQKEHVGLVSYGSNYTGCTLSNPAVRVDHVLTENGNSIRNAVNAIGGTVFNGGTEIGSGINLAASQLTSSAQARPLAYKTMIVLTDGHLSGGPDPVLAAQNAALSDVVVHTITFSAGADQNQMIQVAAAGEGEHYHADDAASLIDVFREIAATLPVTLTE